MKIEIKNYTKIIKDKEILSDINLTLESGQVYGFYGRNGSGKTMLFRAICAFMKPTSGNIYIDGKSVVNDEYDLSNIGVLIETPKFFNYLSGYENLALLYEMNHPRNKQHILDIMDKFDLKEAAMNKYKTYSLGMRQKLAIIQALMEDQQIIILDEPTNGLDEQSVNTFRTIIQEEKDKGKLVLIASHNKDDLKILCEKVYKLEDGTFKGEITL